MKIKFRYDFGFQMLEVDTAEAAHWVNLKLEDYDPSDKDLEEKIQRRVDEYWNKPEYNIWHRETRYIDRTPKRRRMDGRAGYIQADPEDPGFNIMDYLLTTSDEESRNIALEYEEICQWIR
ncbi:MAG: hypothetical protein IKQ27_15990 [Lachnospiraceae bacterium]|nr:hypothetical protein [Lachnospiraceae bacterium]